MQVLEKLEWHLRDRMRTLLLMIKNGSPKSLSLLFQTIDLLLKLSQGESCLSLHFAVHLKIFHGRGNALA